MEAKIDDILAQVTEHYGITPEELFTRTRKREIVFPRQLFFYLCCRYTKKSQDYIGKISERYGIKKYDHATVLHGRNSIQNYIDTDREKRLEILYFKPVMHDKIPVHQMEQHIDHLERDNAFLRANLSKGRNGLLSNCERNLLDVFNQLSEERKANIMSKIRTELKVQQLVAQ